MVLAGLLPELVQAVAAVFEMEAEGIAVGGFVEGVAGPNVEGGVDQVVRVVTDDGGVVEVLALGIGGVEIGWDGFAEGEEEGGAGEDGFVARADAGVDGFEEVFGGEAGIKLHLGMGLTTKYTKYAKKGLTTNGH